MRSLPGADKYRRPAEATDTPWSDPLVVRANTEVRIEDVLNDHFAMHVPMEAEGWKTYCPMREEHDDGGIDRQFRVYSSTNSGHCFALHGSLDPVRLWRQKHYAATLRDAAEGLLRAYGVQYRAKPYWERMAALREPTPFVADPDTVVQALNVFLAAQPAYALRQYDADVLAGVNYVLGEVHAMCSSVGEMEEVAAWLQSAKAQLEDLLSREPPSTHPRSG